MGVRASRNYRHYPRDAKLGTFFNRPLHAIELEDSKDQCEFHHGRGGDFFSQFKFDAACAYGSNSPAMYVFARCNVELLSDSSPKRSHEMIGMLAQQEGAITGDFVGNEAAARHHFSCQLPAASCQ